MFKLVVMYFAGEVTPFLSTYTEYISKSVHFILVLVTQKSLLFMLIDRKKGINTRN